MTAIKWGGTDGPWIMEPDMRQEYDRHSQSCYSHEYLAGYNITGVGEEVVGIEGIIPGDTSEINARAIAKVPAMVQCLREAESCLSEFNEDERRTKQQIQAILARIFVDPSVRCCYKQDIDNKEHGDD